MARRALFVAAMVASGEGPRACADAEPQERPAAGTVEVGPGLVPSQPAVSSAPDPRAAHGALQWDQAPLVVVLDVSPSMAPRMELARQNVRAVVEMAAHVPDRPVQIITFTGAASRWRSWTSAQSLVEDQETWLPQLDWCARDYPPFSDPSSAFYYGGSLVHAAPGMQRCSAGAEDQGWMDGGSNPGAALAMALSDLEAAEVEGGQLVLVTDLSTASCTPGLVCAENRESALAAELAAVRQSAQHLAVVGLRSRHDGAERRERFQELFGDWIIAMPLFDR